MTKPITTRRRGFLVALNSVVRHFGVCVIPLAEIVSMETGAASDYRYMQRPGLPPFDIAYFNGLADYASKTADRLRCHYMPNVMLSFQEPREARFLISCSNLFKT